MSDTLINPALKGRVETRVSTRPFRPVPGRAVTYHSSLITHY
jgi:hypothetical protein